MIRYIIGVSMLVVLWLVGSPGSLGAGGIGSPVAADRQMVNVLRGDVQRNLRSRCMSNPFTPYAYPNVLRIPTARVRAILVTWRHRKVWVRNQSSRCSRIPAWPWLALASCESGRDWDYNGSSGFDGGFQFLPSTWNMAKQHVPRARGYAYAWQAPAYVQYLVARDWLRRTSWAQWPTCSRRIGARP